MGVILGRGRMVLALMFAAALAGGCSEQVVTYQVPGAPIASGQKILILPFMDTRTLVAEDDSHKDDLGKHAREIFAEAVRNNPAVLGAEVLTPDLPAQTRSLTTAEVAEIGREHGAQVVVAGQIFSFSGTRAASIPPRAGMFVRVVSSRDGALLFVGDHYQAAAVPGAGGGRELQARNVSNKLVEGILNQVKSLADATAAKVASGVAYASLAAARPVRPIANNDSKTPQPEPPPLLGLGGNTLIEPVDWDERIAPEVPPLVDFDDNFAKLPPPPPMTEVPEAPPPLPPEPLPEAGSGVAAKEPAAPAEPALPNLADLDLERVVKTESPAVAAGAAENPPVPDGIAALPPPPELRDVAETESPEAAAPAETADAGAEKKAKSAAETPEEMYARIEAEVPDASYAAGLSGDELAADLLESDGELPGSLAYGHETETLAAEPEPATARKDGDGADGGTVRESQVASASTGPAARDDLAAMAAPAAPTREGRVIVDPVTGTMASPTPVERAALVYGMPELARPAPMEPLEPERPRRAAARPRLAEPIPAPDEPAVMVVRDDGPVVSIPLAVEQPRPVRFVDLVELPPDPDAATISFDPEVKAPALASISENAIRVLVLPYHDRENPNNLIANTGGGEVVTTLYGARLALDPAVQVLWDASGQATHDRLVDRDEAVQLGRMVNADFVVRGQVVEFRRAQSVPSFYSVVISTAMLAAQIVFAEMSGVDVATEIYRVSDGRCVMSRRDRAQQKYVVQAEKTVRRLAAGMADGVLRAIKADDPESMDPLIDDIEPLSVLRNPKRENNK